MASHSPRAKLTKKYRVGTDDIRLFSQDGTIWTQPIWEGNQQRADYWLVWDETTRESERALDSLVAREFIYRMLQKRNQNPT